MLHIARNDSARTRDRTKRLLIAMNRQSGRPKSQSCHVVLVADDDTTIRNILRSVLTHAGYTVVATASGNEALTYAPNLEFSLAILDLAMPDGDGVEACAALRKLQNWQGVPVLILTSYHTNRSLEAAQRAGATAFLCKPFVPSQLLRRIATLIGEKVSVIGSEPMVWRDVPEASIWRSDLAAQAEALVWRRKQSNDDDATRAVATAPPDAFPLRLPGTDRADNQSALLQVYRRVSVGQPDSRRLSEEQNEAARHRRILIADDDKFTQETVGQILTREGYLAHFSPTGPKVLAAVAGGQYDLILMAMDMPVVPGMTTIQSIRSLPSRKCRTPVVALTKDASQAFMRELASIGMDGYLIKPIKADDLLKCVRDYLPELEPGRSPRLLELDQMRDQIKALSRAGMARNLDNLTDLINDILPRVQGWVATDPADLSVCMRKLSKAANSLGCAALSDAATSIDAEVIPTDEMRKGFAETARATLLALQPFLS